MGDLFLDLRQAEVRCKGTPSDLLNHCGDTKIEIINENSFTLVLARVDSWDIWGPFRSADKRVLTALAGRIALDSPDWEQAAKIEGEGGLACKALYNIYRKSGISGLKELNGSFTAFIYDSTIEKIFIITDRCGMFPCYGDDKEIPSAICSHPDILADVLKLSGEWDMTSLAEFLVTGKVSFPHSFYRRVKALEYGCVHTISISDNSVTDIKKEKYFNFDFKIEPKLSEWDLAEGLSCAFRKAVNRRTLPIFGRSAFSLSAGLDSRALLCSSDNMENVLAFCFFDEINYEFSLARKIAQTADVKFIPFKRDFDHYGINAEKGVQISGGMGDFGSNHYLGFREKFKESGIENILAGFYCDYLFKSLVLNKKHNKFLRTEKFSGFEYSNYMPFFWFNNSHSEKVRERQDTLIPDDLKKDETDRGRLEIERRRLFPLYSEPDNMETLIPQRVMGWYLPIVDNDIIDVYLRIPPAFKLNASMYSKAVELICGEEISRITNINTGTRVNANKASVIYHGYIKSLRSKIKRRKKSIATNESWPNWYYYIQNSNVIYSLWSKRTNHTEDVLAELINEDPFKDSIQDYVGKGKIKLLLRILTLNIWLSQRN
jgi:hypothetical protein